MNETTNRSAAELKDEVKKGLDQLKTLRDEVRVRLHLAGMEAKTSGTSSSRISSRSSRRPARRPRLLAAPSAEAVERLKKLRESL